MSRLKLGLCSCGFLGCIPVAPGTFGTLGGVLIAWLLAGTDYFLLWILSAALVVYLIGRSLGDWAESHAGKKDPGFFVLDEVVGYLVTVAWLEGPSLLALTLAFFAFRLFDIAKPPPIRAVERIGGADGILLDDVVAGAYAFLVIMLPARLFLTANWT